MDISLTPSNEMFLRNKIAEGLYDSLNEAINATLNIAITGSCVPNEELERLNADIQKGIDDYNAGRYTDADTAYKEIMKKYE